MIEIQALRKCFGPLVAVDDISFKVVPGETLGFLGPNGAGKSTTMKVLSGFLAPTSGSVNVCGLDIESDTLLAQKMMGYLPEGAPAYDEMTPLSYLKFVGEIRGLKGVNLRGQIDEVVARMSLREVLGQKIETLSKGFKRRVGLAQAILHDPDVLILDEPTDGLDPNQKYEVREMIRGLSRDKIVIVSTHILEEVTAVCTRALIISHGRLLMDCKPSELEQRSRYHGAVTVRIDEGGSADMIETRLSTLSEVGTIERSADGLEITAFKSGDDVELLGAINRLVIEDDLGITGVYQEKGRLDEVFRAVTTQGDFGEVTT